MHASESTPIDSGTFRALMQNLAGAVAIIATGSVGSRTGLTATAVCPLSDNPPTLIACVNRSASATPHIRFHRRFSVNLLSDSQAWLAERFAGRTGVSGEDRFALGSWIVSPANAPILSNALASLECTLVEEHEYATHAVFTGTITWATANDHASPLVYFRRRFGSFSGAILER
jgi:flavin reductase (DIM6/NTAB) family NADH-FMN oxidoreductase RutF